MQGVGSGTVLGGRYSLRVRLSQGRNLEQWSAHDATLEREVALTIVSSEHPNRAGVLDAARRSAGIEDTRLVRILDVGTQNEKSFIVQEGMSESESLTSVLLQGPLPVEEARRVAGETARGLAAAGQRGLHHLRLTPDDVLIAQDGTVRVRGVAVAAAIDGPDEQEPDAASASRRDAYFLVAILYAGMTARWPLDGKVAGIEPAPRGRDGVVAPSQIASGIPGDLDELCRTTLGEGAGPLTPGDFANHISPWPRDRVPRAGFEPTVLLGLPPESQVSGGAPAFAEGTQPTVAIPTPALPANGPADTGTQAARLPAHDPTDGTVADGTLAEGHRGEGHRSEGLRTERTGTEGQRTERMRPPAGLFARDADDLGPPLPLLPASTAAAPSRGQSALVVLVVAVFVGLALFVGYRGLVGISSGSGDTSASTPAPRPTLADGARPDQTPGPASGGPGSIAILSATGYDPEGDRTEGDSKAARVYDGDPATSWTSSRYATADFGNLKKGVGVLLDLGQPTTIHDIAINLDKGPVDVKVYAATDPRIKGAALLGRLKDASGRVDLKADNTVPQSQYVIVWFTKLAPDGDKFRASISEIALN